MSAIYLPDDVRSLLKGKTIVYIGDSVQRSMYKDLVLLFQEKRYLTDKELRKKGEECFMGDELLEGGCKGEMANSVKYREVRKFLFDSNTKVLYFFITACFGQYIEMILSKLKTPDIIIMNSCLWDVHRYGLKEIQGYETNLIKLVKLVKKTHPKVLFLWTTTPPVDLKSKGGFLKRPGADEVKIFEVGRCNRIAKHVMREEQMELVELDAVFHHFTRHRANDGVHWNEKAHRRMTNMILETLSRSLSKSVPRVMTNESHFIGNHPNVFPPYGHEPHLSHSFSFPDFNAGRWQGRMLDDSMHDRSLLGNYSYFESEEETMPRFMSPPGGRPGMEPPHIMRPPSGSGYRFGSNDPILSQGMRKRKFRDEDSLWLNTPKRQRYDERRLSTKENRSKSPIVDNRSIAMNNHEKIKTDGSISNSNIEQKPPKHVDAKNLKDNSIKSEVTEIKDEAPEKKNIELEEKPPAVAKVLEVPSTSDVEVNSESAVATEDKSVLSPSTSDVNVFPVSVVSLEEKENIPHIIESKEEKMEEDFSNDQTWAIMDSSYCAHEAVSTDEKAAEELKDPEKEQTSVTNDLETVNSITQDIKETVTSMLEKPEQVFDASKVLPEETKSILQTSTSLTILNAIEKSTKTSNEEVSNYRGDITKSCDTGEKLRDLHRNNEELKPTSCSEIVQSHENQSTSNTKENSKETFAVSPETSKDLVTQQTESIGTDNRDTGVQEDSLLLIGESHGKLTYAGVDLISTHLDGGTNVNTSSNSKTMLSTSLDSVRNGSESSYSNDVVSTSTDLKTAISTFTDSNTTLSTSSGSKTIATAFSDSKTTVSTSSDPKTITTTSSDQKTTVPSTPKSLNNEPPKKNHVPVLFYDVEDIEAALDQSDEDMEPYDESIEALIDDEALLLDDKANMPTKAEEIGQDLQKDNQGICKAEKLPQNNGSIKRDMIVNGSKSLQEIAGKNTVTEPNFLSSSSDSLHSSSHSLSADDIASNKSMTVQKENQPVHGLSKHSESEGSKSIPVIKTNSVNTQISKAEINSNCVSQVTNQTVLKSESMTKVSNPVILNVTTSESTTVTSTLQSNVPNTSKSISLTASAIMKTVMLSTKPAVVSSVPSDKQTNSLLSTNKISLPSDNKAGISVKQTALVSQPVKPKQPCVPNPPSLDMKSPFYKPKPVALTPKTNVSTSFTPISSSAVTSPYTPGKFTSPIVISKSVVDTSPLKKDLSGEHDKAKNKIGNKLGRYIETKKSKKKKAKESQDDKDGSPAKKKIKLKANKGEGKTKVKKTEALDRETQKIKKKKSKKKSSSEKKSKVKKATSSKKSKKESIGTTIPVQPLLSNVITNSSPIVSNSQNEPTGPQLISPVILGANVIPKSRRSLQLSNYGEGNWNSNQMQHTNINSSSNYSFTSYANQTQQFQPNFESPPAYQPSPPVAPVFTVTELQQPQIAVAQNTVQQFQYPQQYYTAQVNQNASTIGYYPTNIQYPMQSNLCFTDNQAQPLFVDQSLGINTGVSGYTVPADSRANKEYAHLDWL